MSIDHYYTLQNGKFVCIDAFVFSKRWREDERPDFHTDFWVDIAHAGCFLIDERYYFPDQSTALDFYLEGWRQRQFVDDKGNGVGLHHSGLYVNGRLVDGASIHGDLPGHEGEKLRDALGCLCNHLEECERKPTKTETKKRRTQ